ncbi:MAG TPA: hypothetical protein PKA27_03915 [Fimbriimonadaceae bacterium]|nr:hypothetical protein [Fimbriimonadaceae bacterium]
MKRILLLLLATLVVSQGFAQGKKPDIVVVVTEHQTSAEMVEVTAALANYPPDLLKTQCEKIGNEVGTAVRGLKVYTVPINETDPNMRFLKASFATNGLIDRAAGTINLQAIIRAFAGAQEAIQVTQLSIIFAGEQPTAKTVKTYSKPGVLQATATASVTPPGLEYHVVLESQDPKVIEFPSEVDGAKPVEEKQPTNQSNQTLVYALLAIAALSLGALVYSLFLRTGRKKP